MPSCYAYRRVSTQRQADRGGSLEAQETQCRDYWKYRMENQGFAFAGVFTDSAQSGSTTMIKRPAAAQLNALLQPGDAVIINRLDRGFRNLKDLLNTIDYWKGINVSLHLLDIGVDTGSDIGRLMISVIGAVSEFEKNIRNERVRLAINALKKMGYAARGGIPPYGLKTAGKPGRKKYVPCPEQRKLGKQIVAWRDAGWTRDKVWLYIASHRQFWWKGARMGWGAIQMWEKWERALQAKEAAKAAEKAALQSTQPAVVPDSPPQAAPPPIPQIPASTTSEILPDVASSEKAFQGNECSTGDFSV